MGASSLIIGEVTTHAAIAVGAGAEVDGNIKALAAVTFGAGAGVVPPGRWDASYTGLAAIPTKALAALTDVQTAYDKLLALPSPQGLDASITTEPINPSNPLLTREVLLPGLYEQHGAWPGTKTRDVEFDAQGDPNAIWIIRIKGASAIDGTFALVNGAKAENIQWVVTGAFALNLGSTCFGTVITDPFLLPHIFSFFLFSIHPIPNSPRFRP
jgi:hypothetical protein